MYYALLLGFNLKKKKHPAFSDETLQLSIFYGIIFR